LGVNIASNTAFFPIPLVMTELYLMNGKGKHKMKFPEITNLYKYYVYNVNSLSVLINRRVWFPKPDSFNDPFDCNIPFDNHINLRELENFLPRYKNIKGLSEKELDEEILKIKNERGQVEGEFKEIYSNVLKVADEQLRNSGVFSLTQCNNNILMWSHYADHHKGFCIEFVRSPQNDLGDYEKTRRVKYPPNYPIVSPLSTDVFDLKFFTKAIDWKYEKEWRLVNEEGNMEKSLPGDISAIIFGLRMPDLHKKAIQKIMSDLPDIKYCQPTKVLNQFKLKIEDL
jgi:hypothetical protein